MRAKWLYRLESSTPGNGLWYDAHGNWVWGIGALAGSRTKDLPMGYDPRYHVDGRNWFSSCSRREDLLHWYSLSDARDLLARGFVFARYLARDFIEYERETVFLKETILARVEMDIFSLFSNNSTEQQERKEH